MKHELFAGRGDLVAFGHVKGPAVKIRFNGDILVNGEISTNPEVIVKAIRESAIKAGENLVKSMAHGNATPCYCGRYDTKDEPV